MPSPRSFLALALPVLAASCATVSHDALTPVRALRHESLKCVIETGDQGLPEITSEDWTASAEAVPYVSLTCQLFLVEPEQAERALSARVRGLVGAVCSRADARLLVEELEALERLDATHVETLAGPIEMTMHDGGKSALSVTNQEAFIAAYEMTATADQAIADPRVEVIDDGVLLRAAVDLDPDTSAIHVDLELLLSELERPFARLELPLGRGFAPVTLQRPEGVLRKVSTSTVLGPDEALVLGGAALSVGGGGRTLVVVVEAEPVDPAGS